MEVTNGAKKHQLTLMLRKMKVIEFTKFNIFLCLETKQMLDWLAKSYQIVKVFV